MRKFVQVTAHRVSRLWRLARNSMLLGSDTTPFDAIHLDTDVVAVGSFRLGCERPQFVARKALLNHHVVLPRSPLCILQDGVAPFVADPVMVTFHNPGVPYRREPIAGRDDDCDYVVLHEEVVDEIAGELGLSRKGRRSNYRFASSQCALSQRAFAAARRTFNAARTGALRDELAFEEFALAFAVDAIAGLGGGHRSSARSTAELAVATGTPRFDAVARAKRYLAERPGRANTLAEIARAAHVSPYHLTRLFRARTGLSLHQYVMTLKLRIALGMLDEYDGRLDCLAAELGFTDLPHLSRLFARAFDVSPSVFLGRRRATRARSAGWSRACTSTAQSGVLSRRLASEE